MGAETRSHVRDAVIPPADLPDPADMKADSLVGHGDNGFKLESAGNRNGCHEPYVLLAEMFCANGYQQHIAAFLPTAAAKPTRSEFFAETIVPTILKDLGRGA